MFLEEEKDEREELDEEDEGYLEEEETLEELDVDDRGHVRPRRSRFDNDDEGDGLYEEAEPEY
jgi:hypothetical protein